VDSEEIVYVLGKKFRITYSKLPSAGSLGWSAEATVISLPSKERLPFGLMGESKEKVREKILQELEKALKEGSIDSLYS